MNTNKLKKIFFTLFFTAAIASSSAQSSYTVKVVKATIKGTSSLNDWESNITKITCKGSFEASDVLLQAIKNVEVKVAVKGIKSKEGKIMDNKTYEAFAVDKNPYITFAFSNADVVTNADNLVSITALGNLTMAGTTKKIDVFANGKVLENGDIELAVSKMLNMTEFNMTPPAAVLGTIKVGEEVTINIYLLLLKSKIVLVKK